VALFLFIELLKSLIISMDVSNQEGRFERSHLQPLTYGEAAEENCECQGNEVEWKSYHG